MEQNRDEKKDENEKKKEYLKRYHSAVLAEKAIQQEIDEQLWRSVGICGAVGRIAGGSERTDGEADQHPERDYAENRTDAG